MKKIKLYIDICVYNRPFDDQHQPRISLESQIFLFLMKKVEEGELTTIHSFVLKFENNRSPLRERRGKVADLFSLASEYVHYDKLIEERAQQLEQLSFLGIDALHIACAEAAKASYFVSCDDILVKKCKKNQSRLRVKVLSLMEVIAEGIPL